MDATVVCIDQTKKSVQVEPRAAWFPRGTRPSIELSGQRDWTCLLGAVTENGDCFFSRFTEYVTADHAKHIILSLCKEFEEDLIVVLDGHRISRHRLSRTWRPVTTSPSSRCLRIRRNSILSKSAGDNSKTL